MNETRATTSGAAGEYPIGPSWQLAAILTAGHGVVALIILFTDFALAARLAILAVLFASLIFELRTTALRLGANAVIAVRISAADIFSAQTRRHGWCECEVLGSTYVTAALTVLNLRMTGARRVRSVVLMRDSIAADDFRRLRLWLRWRLPPRTG